MQRIKRLRLRAYNESLLQQIGNCNFKKSYWRDNGAPDNSNSTELKLKDETEVKFRDSIYESVRTEIQQ